MDDENFHVCETQILRNIVKKGLLFPEMVCVFPTLQKIQVTLSLFQTVELTSTLGNSGYCRSYLPSTEQLWAAFIEGCAGGRGRRKDGKPCFQANQIPEVTT